MKREDIDINHFKELLLKEQERLVTDLKSVGRINPNNPNDWEAVPGDVGLGTDTSDKNDYADQIENFEGNTAILKSLETELTEVKAALVKTEGDTYGICEESGEPIAKERLEAYPAARTCE